MAFSIIPEKKYVVLVTCMLGQCITSGIMSIFGAFTENFLADFGVSNASVALISAIAQCLFSGAGIILQSRARSAVKSRV